MNEENYSWNLLQKIPSRFREISNINIVAKLGKIRQNQKSLIFKSKITFNVAKWALDDQQIQIQKLIR